MSFLNNAAKRYADIFGRLCTAAEIYAALLRELDALDCEWDPDDTLEGIWSTQPQSSPEIIACATAFERLEFLGVHNVEEERAALGGAV